MKNYVISMISSNKRRQHICHEFAQLGIKFNFFDAITPDKNQYFCEKLSLDINKFDISPTEISCFLSHIFLWKQAQVLNLKYIAVFEDDIYLGENAALFLNSEDWIPEHIDIIKLEYFNHRIEVLKSKSINTLDHRGLYRLISVHLGGAGYIISNQTIEFLLSELLTLNQIQPIDHFLFEDMLGKTQVFQILPAICIQDSIKYQSYDNFGSNLEKERKERQNNFIRVKVKLPLIAKLYREVFRVLKQLKSIIKKVLYQKNISFR